MKRNGEDTEERPSPRTSALHSHHHPLNGKIFSVSDTDRTRTQLPPPTKNSPNPSKQTLRTMQGDAIRNRFLYRLGIQPQGRRIPSPASFSLPRSDSFCESLKADRGKQDPTLDDDSSAITSISSSLDSYHSSVSCKMVSKKVSFRTAVTVHPIPSRTSYSDRIRQQLWMPTAIQEMNTERNAYEFAAEQWDWTRVVEDELFIEWNGERIHPAHLQDCRLNQHFLAVMAQR